MTVSTNAILFYGYCWDEEAQNPWEIDCENDANDEDDEENTWETRYARARGCLPPRAPFPARTVARTRENNWDSTPKNYSAAEQAIISQHTAYWAAKEKLIEASACLVGTHCSASCPMPYVAVRASMRVSHRGDPTEVTPLIVEPAWNAALTAFCETMKIEVADKKPAWWLVSDWSE